MTAVLEIQGRGRTTFCRPVPSRALGSPPAGPYGGPGRLRTLGSSLSNLPNSQHYQTRLDGCVEANALGVDFPNTNWLQGIAADFPRGEIQGASTARNWVHKVSLGDNKDKNTTSGAKPNNKPKLPHHTFASQAKSHYLD